MVRKAQLRAKKYGSKEDPVIVALRYKMQSVWFQPEMIKLQTILDNTDRKIKDVLDALEFPLLRRNNARLFMQGFYKLIDSFGGQTLINKVNDLLVKYNLTQDEFNGIVEYLRDILVQEGIYDKCGLDTFNKANVKIGDSKLFHSDVRQTNQIGVKVLFNP